MVSVGNSEGVFIQSEQHTTLLRTLLREREHGKQCYIRSGEALDQLLLDVPPGTRLDLDGKSYEVKDNFAKRNTHFQPCGVKRFEVVESKETE